MNDLKTQKTVRYNTARSGINNVLICLLSIKN